MKAFTQIQITQSQSHILRYSWTASRNHFIIFASFKCQMSRCWNLCELDCVCAMNGLIIDLFENLHWTSWKLALLDNSFLIHVFRRKNAKCSFSLYNWIWKACIMRSNQTVSKFISQLFDSSTNLLRSLNIKKRKQTTDKHTLGNEWITIKSV